MKKSATKKQSAKVTEEILTVEKLLGREGLKDLANKIVNEDVDDVILIYRNKKSGSLCWATIIADWAVLFGSMDMTQMMMREDWEIQRFGEDEEDG